MAQNLDRIAMGKSSRRIFCAKDQIVDRLLVVVPSLKVQCQLCRLFLFARIAECPESLCQLQMQFCSRSLGKPPVQYFPVKRMPELVVSGNLSVRQYVDSRGLDELQPVGKP